MFCCFELVGEVDGVESVEIVDVDCVVPVCNTEEDVVSLLKMVTGVDIDPLDVVVEIVFCLVVVAILVG